MQHKVPQMWHQEETTAFNVRLKPVTVDDLEQLRVWRNCPDIARHMLDQREIGPTEQQSWFQRIALDQHQMQFIIYYKNLKVGACNLKATTACAITKNDTIETGFYIGEPKYRGTMLAFFAALALNQYAFERLGVKVLQAKVKKSNNAALRFNMQLGYIADTIPTSIDMVAMTLVHQAHQATAVKFSSFIRS